MKRQACQFLGLLDPEDNTQRSFETSASIYQTTRFDTPNGLNLQQRLCGNLNSHARCILFVNNNNNNNNNNYSNFIPYLLA